MKLSKALRDYIDARCETDDPETLLVYADLLADAVAEVSR